VSEPSNPNSGWFPKGTSGNRKGRRAGSRAPKASAFEVLTDTTVAVNGPGGPRQIPTEEAIQWRVYQDALAGKTAALRQVVKWIMKREAWLAERAPKAAAQPITRHISRDPDNADAALVLLEIAAHNPARANIGLDRAQLLLEPWAPQLALRRRRGGNRLTASERDAIRRSSRDPDSLRWPRGTDE
jgi:Family of unknown function (DUF5681)